MLTREEDIDVHALRRQGMSISAIARHLGRDRTTIRAYLNGDRVAGVRKTAEADRLGPFLDYVRERLKEDPHLKPAAIQSGQVSAREPSNGARRDGSVGHVEVFRTGCVRTPILGRPRRLTGHRRADLLDADHSLICEEPHNLGARSQALGSSIVDALRFW